MPVAVASRSASASISASPAAPMATSPCRNAHRASASTTRPSSVREPSSRPRRTAACSSVRAALANVRDHCSWVSLPGAALSQRGQRVVGQRRPAGRRPGRVGVGGQRRLHPGQQRLDDADLGLGVDAGQHQLHPVAGRQLGVAGHVPGRRPAQRPGQGVGEGADPGAQRGQRPLVEPQLGVGEVVVVDQHEVGGGVADQLGDLGARARDVELHPRAAGQPVRALAVEADGQPVVAQHRVLGDGGLLDREAGVPAVVGQLEDRPQGVDLAGLQPLLDPLRQVAAGALLERGQQVGQRRCCRTRGGGSTRRTPARNSSRPT